MNNNFYQTNNKYLVHFPDMNVRMLMCKNYFDDINLTNVIHAECFKHTELILTYKSITATSKLKFKLKDGHWKFERILKYN